MPDFGRWSAGGGDPSLNEINRADQFFEALASRQPVYSTDREEAELAFLFAELRDGVRDAPVTAPVTPADAVVALQNGLPKHRGGRRSFAVVGSVAAAMLCIGGFGTAIYGAGPGDSLYGMRTSIFGQSEATRDDQVSLASAQLQQVQQLIDNGQWEEAQSKLAAVSTTVQNVDAPVQSKQQLVEQWNALTYKVVEQNPAATLAPGEPLPALPSSPLTWLPVPVETSTSATATSDSPSSSTQTSGSSDTSPTSPSESPASSAPSGSSTPPSEGSTVSSPSSSAASSSAPVAEPAPSSTPPSSPAGSTTTTPAGSTATTTTASPTTTTATTTATTASPTTTATTTTTVPRPPEASQPAAVPVAPSPVVRLAPSPPAAPTPAQPSLPAATSTAPAEPTAATTTTTVVPRG